LNETILEKLKEMTGGRSDSTSGLFRKTCLLTKAVHGNLGSWIASLTHDETRDIDGQTLLIVIAISIAILMGLAAFVIHL
jgi:hypothetical protein